jgi:hypothetical protein
MRSLLVVMITVAPGVAEAQSVPQTPAACERLASLSLPNTTITLAQVVNAGAFAVPVNAPREGGGSSALAGTIGPVPAVPGRVTANTAGLGLGYNGGRGIPPFSALPAFCRVTATLRPSPSSDIRMEVWMPVTGWNGNFRGTSPNGLGGVINWPAQTQGIRAATPPGCGIPRSSQTSLAARSTRRQSPGRLLRRLTTASLRSTRT